ncbi:type IV pilus biogenesis/stability protein PilW [Glaciimonas sp. PAMC28666]|uniref:type IV pilus biogenesis/stability protein PilW n=1 Tax=Glaciimonas sp. PAMC28666 TaxID=2807626 RepID=UPI001965DB42|nr:type IV pilus biogenesis/stability protein PilW [Glaciimonas sp. PAMC28666]QRX83004.1 type IV pilus biogenesis/stability protein PilW [Glaciimonas sp. PAMC28666]
MAIAAALTLLAGCATTSGGNSANNGESGARRELATNSDLTDAQRRARIRLELAVGYYGQGQLTVALDEVKQSLSSDPQFADAYSMRGLIYMDMGETGLADDNLQKALKLAPDNPDIANNYGWFLCKNGREKESIAYFQMALNSRSYLSPAKALTNAGVCSLKMKDSVSAERYFLQAFQFDASNPLTNVNLAMMAAGRRDVEHARFYMGLVTKQDALNADVLWIGIKVERKLNDRVAETNLVTQLRRVYPGSAEYASYQRGVFDE